MTRIEFLNVFAEIVQESHGTLPPDRPLDGLARWDSMAILDFMSEMDKCFGAAVPLRTLSQCKTVGDVLRIVEPHLSERGNRA